MSFLVELFRPKADLPTPLAQALDAWRALPAVPDRTPLAQARVVVVNVETSGFDARHNRLLALGAVAIEGLRVMSTQAFGVVLRPDEMDEPGGIDEVVRHRVTPSMQAAGMEADEALGEFLAFVGKAPCLAFHAAFAQTVLDRALRAELGVRFVNPWVDMAPLAPRLVSEARLARIGLDDWLQHFGLRVLVRDHAVHDAQVTAELCLILLQRAAVRGIATLSDLRDATRAPERIATGNSGVSGR